MVSEPVYCSISLSDSVTQSVLPLLVLRSTMRYGDMRQKNMRYSLGEAEGLACSGVCLLNEGGKLTRVDVGQPEGTQVRRAARGDILYNSREGIVGA